MVMSQSVWTAVDEYLADVLLPADPVLDAALVESDEAGMPAINVASNQGMMLHLFARMRGARSILEIGTLGGYSTIWLARALPEDGRLVTLEFDPEHARVAQINLARAGLDALVDIRVGDAVKTLPQLIEEGTGPFDFIFIDADKVSYPEYLKYSLQLSAPGTVIVADNIVRNGAVTEVASDDANVQGVRRFLELIGGEPRVTATALQTVGVKGYDGFVLATVNS